MILEGPRDLAEESRLVVGMIPDPQVLLVGVTMNVTPRRVNDRLSDFLRVDLEDSGLLLIDPNDCMFHDDLLGRVEDFLTI